MAPLASTLNLIPYRDRSEGGFEGFVSPSASRDWMERLADEHPEMVTRKGAGYLVGETFVKCDKIKMSRDWTAESFDLLPLGLMVNLVCVPA